MFLHNLLNVLVQIANRIGLPKKKILAMVLGMVILAVTFLNVCLGTKISMRAL
jgi:hypothetical protein